LECEGWKKSGLGGAENGVCEKAKKGGLRAEKGILAQKEEALGICLNFAVGNVGKEEN
jgi:hypothetical protein